MALGAHSMMGVQMVKKKVKVKVVFVPDVSYSGCDKCCFAGTIVKCMIEHGHLDCCTGDGGYWLIKRVEPCPS